MLTTEQWPMDRYHQRNDPRRSARLGSNISAQRVSHSQDGSKSTTGGTARLFESKNSEGATVVRTGVTTALLSIEKCSWPLIAMSPLLCGDLRTCPEGVWSTGRVFQTDGITALPVAFNPRSAFEYEGHIIHCSEF